MGTRGMPVAELPYRDLSEAPQLNDPSAYATFERWLANVEATLEREDRTLLLAFDEFEKLEEAAQAGDLNLRLLLDWYRQIIQYHPRIALLFSDVRTISEMGNQTGMNWSGYFVNVQTLKVSFLARDEAHHLIIHPCPDYPGETIFSNDVVEQIIHETGCHPFLIQAVCAELIDSLNIQKREQAELDDVQQAVDQVLEGWNDYFNDLWLRTDDTQRACLLAMQGQNSTDLPHLQQQTNFDEKTIRRTLQTLLRRDLICRNDDQTYRIATPIFSKWVEKSSYT